MADSTTTELTTDEAVTLMIWSGRCGGCGALVFFGADSETDSARAKEISTTWPGSYPDGGFSWDCMACDGKIDWNGNDPTSRVLPAFG